jgi:hypothetical protein
MYCLDALKSRMSQGLYFAVIQKVGIKLDRCGFDVSGAEKYHREKHENGSRNSLCSLELHNLYLR